MGRWREIAGDRTSPVKIPHGAIAKSAKAEAVAPSSEIVRGRLSMSSITSLAETSKPRNWMLAVMLT